MDPQSLVANPRETTCHVTAHACPTSSRNTAIDEPVLFVEKESLVEFMDCSRNS